MLSQLAAGVGAGWCIGDALVTGIAYDSRTGGPGCAVRRPAWQAD
jgi:hypothetical protein